MTFLQHVATDILQKHGTDLSRVAVVFPNKRASLFLNSYLAEQAGKPIWSPAYITISDLFRNHSSRTVADPIKLVCELHKSFTAMTGIDETLDHFYGWGQLLLSDFDDLDKHMADADKVLANLRDLHELDDVSYLTQEQKDTIRKFFSNFTDEHNTLLKERFLKLWSHMADIYHDFNRRLEQQQLAYEGALCREVAGRAAEVDFRYDTYIFVGFNLLQQVEQRLFTTLKRQGRARFYWDFDRYYMPSKGTQAPHEAGHFISQYLADYPNELPLDSPIYNCFAGPKQIHLVSAPTENIQARYAGQWLSEQQRAAHGRRTAIVLCNEGLLPTVIHCLPSAVSQANVTTGYPLAQSPAATLVTQLIGLQTAGYAAQRDRYRLHHVNMVLRHPYLAFISPQIPALQKLLNEKKIYYPSREVLAIDEGTSLIFRRIDSDRQNASLLQWLCDLLQAVSRTPSTEGQHFTQESLFRVYTILNRLLSLVDDGDLLVDTVTLQRLIGQLLQSATVPFHGEPAEGLQVMGVLETRNLDFDHVLMLSCNEGNMPRGITDSSFIPYGIRKAYGLTTTDHKVALQSYYFHRLLQRAADVTIVYNNATTDGQTGQMSQFVLQLMVEDHHHTICRQTLRASQQTSPFQPKEVAKTAFVIQKLQARFSSAGKAAGQPLLTPTAINRYLRCPLMFYYNYVYDLREPDTNDEDVIDNRVFGNIFHEASRTVYTRLMERSHQIVASDIEALLKTRVDIERAVDQAFRTELFQIRDPHATFHPELNGLQLISREVIIHYLRQLLDIDRRLAPFTIIGLETDVVAPLLTPHLDTTVGGRIDRLDRIVRDGVDCIRVVDYKTGSKLPSPLADVDAIFKQESLANHSDYYLQTFLYGCIVRSQHPATPVAPALLFIQHAGADDYDPVLKFGRDPIDDVARDQQRFSQLLREVVGQMFDPDLPFTPTPDRSRCTNCPYRQLCTV
ncbi:MAG: PD-(D/E)XK nuclease family protein [Prevotella sp.]|nr:PD-(D/E)XK nuclease family protein [Prevotella sp.]